MVIKVTPTGIKGTLWADPWAKPGGRPLAKTWGQTGANPEGRPGQTLRADRGKPWGQTRANPEGRETFLDAEASLVESKWCFLFSSFRWNSVSLFDILELI